MGERREEPRYERLLDLTVGTPGAAEVCAKSGNISRKGLSCMVPEYVEPFSKLTVVAELVDADGDKRKLSCEGVVVRTEPEEPSAEVEEYNVAIYFTNLSPETAAAIDDYLLLDEG